MNILINILLVVIGATPIWIAVKRKHANITLLVLLELFFSWTIIGWFAVMAWAIWGRSDPVEFAKQSGEV